MMGILSIFGIGSSQLSKKAIEKATQSLTNPYTQPDIRQEQVDKLLKDKSAAAIDGLLMRFTVMASQGIIDEQEKQSLVDSLVNLGPSVLEPIQRYLRKETNLTYAFLILKRVLEPAQFQQELLALCQVYPPSDYRSDQQKKQLLLALKENPTELIIQTIVPYLHDHSDEVRYSAIELVHSFIKNNPHTAVQTPAQSALFDLITTEDTSARIAQKAAESIIQLGLTDAVAVTRPIHLALRERYLISPQKQFIQKS